MTIFGLGALAGGRRPGPEVLARTFALSPLDTFGDLELSDGFSVWAIPIFAVRVAFVTSALALVLHVRPTTKTFAKVAGIYMLSALSMSLPVLTGFAYFMSRSNSSAERSPASLGLLLLFVLILIVLAALLAPLAGRAVLGEAIRPLFTKPSIWGLAALSVLIWLFGTGAIRLPPGVSPSALGYVVAFAVVVTQSVLYGAVAISSRQDTSGDSFGRTGLFGAG